MDKVLVTGATGNVGSAVVEFLENAGLPVIKAQSRQSGSNSFRFDFRDPATFTATGFDRVFLLRPPDLSNIERDMLPALHWFRDCGIRHVVFLSVLGAERSKLIPHRKIELALMDLDLPATFLRPNFFMQNLSGIHALELVRDDQLMVPASRVKMALIDTRDIAEIAAGILEKPDSHRGKHYELNGPELLDYYELADVFSAELGRDIEYCNPYWWQFAWRMRKRKLKPAQIMVMLTLYTVTRMNPAKHTGGDSEELLGRAPTCFRDFVRRERKCWDPVAS